MLSIEQRAHDIALALTMQVHEKVLEGKLRCAQISNDGKETPIEVPIDVEECINNYCSTYDALCEELAKRMS